MKTQQLTPYMKSVCATGMVLALVSCGDGGGDAGPVGGSPGTGATGAAGTGGLPSGGASTGGASTGGTAETGGSPAGGTSTGGTSSGGTPTGGAPSGGSGGGLGQVGPADVTLTVNTAITHQTLVGFGAAVAWYQSNLTTHEDKEALYPLLFAELGLDVLRYRNTYQRGGASSDLSAELEIQQRATSSLGRPPIVLVTSWSPPSTLKANGAEDCNGASNCTLRKVNGQFDYDGFANYWADSVAYYQAAGIPVDYVSLQNEPDFLPSWEGCRFDASESSSYPGYGVALSRVAARLDDLAARPKILGPETLGIHWNKIQSYYPELDASLLAGAAHHLYEMGNDGQWDWSQPGMGPDSFIDEMQAVKAVVGSKPIFQTEFQTDGDGGSAGGFETAWLIHDTLVEENAVMWLYWNLVWGAGSGLVALPSSSSYAVRDQYYSLRHFARYTDPGYVRVEVTSTSDDLRASGYRSPAGDQVTLVLLNTSTNEATVAVDPGDSGATHAEVFRTVYDPGQSETWVDQGGLAPGNVVTLPARSVATVVLR